MSTCGAGVGVYRHKRILMYEWVGPKRVPEPRNLHEQAFAVLLSGTWHLWRWQNAALDVTYDHRRPHVAISSKCSPFADIPDLNPCPPTTQLP